MNFKAAIHAVLIAAIVTKCGVSYARAKAELQAAKKTAKKLGLPLAVTLKTLGLV